MFRVRDEAVTDGVRPRGYMRRSTGLLVENAASQRFVRVGRSLASTSETYRVMVFVRFFFSGTRSSWRKAVKVFLVLTDCFLFSFTLSLERIHLRTKAIRLNLFLLRIIDTLASLMIK